MNGLSCFEGAASRRKRNANNPTTSIQCLPTNPVLRQQARGCLRTEQIDRLVILAGQTPASVASTVEPCPCTRQQAQEECGRFRLDPSNAQCYITSMPVSVNVQIVRGVEAFQRCCYEQGG